MTETPSALSDVNELDAVTSVLDDDPPVDDPNLGATLYWGLLPDCQYVRPGLPAAAVASMGPCILHRDKTGAGNAVVTFYLPYPWDAGFHGG